MTTVRDGLKPFEAEINIGLMFNDTAVDESCELSHDPPLTHQTETIHRVMKNDLFNDT